MTPKEQYDTLKKYFKGHSIVSLDPEESDVEWEKSEKYFADQCVLICVETVINQIKGTPDYASKKDHLKYWEEVKGLAKV